MKKIIIIFSLLIIAFIAIYSSSNRQKNNETSAARNKIQNIIQNYPWQIAIMEDGKSKVFGIVLSATELRRVSQIFNEQPQLAVFEQNSNMSLEAYYKNVTRGGLIGDYIFTLDASSEQLDQLKLKSFKHKLLNNNGRRYDLGKDALQFVNKWKVKYLSYIPVVQLDEKMILKRFGQPAKKIQTTIKTAESESLASWHYLYPDKGLDIIINENGKDLFQYVLPENFNLLLEPLQPH